MLRMSGIIIPDMRASTSKRFEAASKREWLLRLRNLDAEAQFLFHIRLHVSPRGWAVGHMTLHVEGEDLNIEH